MGRGVSTADLGGRDVIASPAGSKAASSSNPLWPSDSWFHTPSSGGPRMGLHRGLHLRGEILAFTVPGGRDPPTRNWAATGHGWSGHTPPASTSCGQDPRNPKRTNDYRPAIRFKRRSRITYRVTRTALPGTRSGQRRCWADHPILSYTDRRPHPSVRPPKAAGIRAS